MQLLLHALEIASQSSAHGAFDAILIACVENCMLSHRSAAGSITSKHKRIFCKINSLNIDQVVGVIKRVIFSCLT